MAANVFAVTAGGIEVMATMSIGTNGDDATGLDRLGMPDMPVSTMMTNSIITAEGRTSGLTSLPAIAMTGPLTR